MTNTSQFTMQKIHSLATAVQLEIIIISKTVNSETLPSQDEEISRFIVRLRILKTHTKLEHCAKVMDK